MLRALWTDTSFNDGATSRGLVELPDEVNELLRELSVQGKRHGGLHAVSGTLGSSAEGSVRLALMELIFRSVGLPAQYNLAQFILWLRDEKIELQVREFLESNGYDWNEELDNFLVADGIPEALVHLKPNLYSSTNICNQILFDKFRSREDISNEEMVKAIKRALSNDDQMPLTLVALDEVQQFIGQNEDRSIAVQELVETCQRNFSSKMMFIATGQTAVTGTHNLKKLEGRFTIRIELSETDVDSVIRRVILAKKPEAIQPIKDLMDKNLGEISRHLHGTTIGHKQSDLEVFTQDYPVLPVRRRFWEQALKVLDNTGTESQLRNQLNTIHTITKATMEKPIGFFVGADFIYFDNQVNLLQTGTVPKKVYQYIQHRIDGSDNDRLLARAVAIVFLINKLSQSRNELGIRSTVDVVADLLVEDISNGSSELRSRLPKLMDESEILFIGDGGEYRIQTEESTAWNDEMRNQKSKFENSSHLLDIERGEWFKRKWQELFKQVDQIQHGETKVPRKFKAEFGPDQPKNEAKEVNLWIRTGWDIDESSVIAEARQSGFESPLIYIHIPKQSSTEFRSALMDLKASSATIEIKGIPSSVEGNEAKASMENIRFQSEQKIRRILDDLFASTKVIQSGGNEVLGVNLQSKVKVALETSVARLYPRFDMADDQKWSNVLRKASQGASDALNDLSYQGEVGDQPVCKELLQYLGAGKTGLTIRDYFESSPYGWSRDAIDGALHVLMANGLVRAIDDRSNAIDHRKIDRNTIGKLQFRAESVTISTKERLEIRKLFSKIGLKSNPNDDAASVPEFINMLEQLISSAGGDAPLPETPSFKDIEEVKKLVGNEQLNLIYQLREVISQNIDVWRSTTQAIQRRLPIWIQIKEISERMDGFKGLDPVLSRIETIEENRQLLQEPDMISPLLKELTEITRQELNRLKALFISEFEMGEKRIKEDKNWMSLLPDEKMLLRAKHSLLEHYHPVIDVSTAESIMATLQRTSMSTIKDRISALKTRYNDLMIDVGRKSEPAAKSFNLPRRMLKTNEEVTSWLKEVEDELRDQINKGPIIIS